MAFRRSVVHLLIFVGAVLALLAPAHAQAHAGHTGPAQTFTQDVGPYELSITIEIPSATPAPLYLDIMPPDDIGGATIELRVVPRGQSFANAPAARIRTIPGPQGIYYTDLPVDRDGDWDLEVRVNGAKGSGIAHIPFTISIPPLPASTIILLVSIGGLIVLMLISIGLSAISNRWPRPVPGWVNWLVGQGIFACLIVAAIFGIQQISARAQSAQGASPTAPATYGVPHANVALSTNPTEPEAGRPLTLTLDLSDGSTGLPVEDLVPHHEALMHLVVIDADGAFFAHVHPARIAPGRYTSMLTPDRPGRYTAYVEIARQDGGVRVIARDFHVGGTAPAAPPPPAIGLGTRMAGGMQVNVTSSATPIKAGRQTTLTFSFTEGGSPVSDLRPWLGMAGHLIVRGAEGAIYGHVHAFGPMGPGGLTASAVSYGPDVRFVYTFPQPGRYQLWGQFKHSGEIVTVPVVVEVE
jgi:hypothetical protein